MKKQKREVNERVSAKKERKKNILSNIRLLFYMNF